MCTATSHCFLWPKELRDALKEGKEVPSQAPWKLGAGTLQLGVKTRKQLLPAPESVCILLPQCAPANQAGSVSDCMSYYKILVRTEREMEGLKFDNC